MRPRTSLALSIALLCAVVVPFRAPAQAPPSVTAGVQPSAGAARVQVSRTTNKLKWEQSANAFPAGHPRTESDWMRRERERFSAILAASTFDILVLPVQVEFNAFNAGTRMLLADLLARAIARATGKRVADPYLVGRALGEGVRRLDPARIEALAEQTGVSSIVQIFSGHEPTGTMAVSLERFEHSAATPFSAFTPVQAIRVRGLSYAMDRPPQQALGARMHELLAGIGFDLPEPIERATARSELARALPSSVFALAEPASPVDRALRLQALAMLAPRTATQLRARMFARSLAELAGLPPASQHYRLVRARALMHLGWRPAALATLAQPADAAERALAATLDGNLPDVESELSSIESPLLRLFSQVEANDMRAEYEVNDEALTAAATQSLSLPSAQWRQLVEWRMRDWDTWFAPGNASVKSVLDEHFPGSGPSLQTLSEAAQTEADLAQLDARLDSAVLEHVFDSMRAKAARACCAPGERVDPAVHDLEYLEALAVGNVVRRIRRESEVRGLYQDTLDRIVRLGPLFSQHPQLTQLQADIHTALSHDASPAEREAHQQRAYRLAMDVLYWEQGQSLLAAQAYALIHNSRRNDYGRMLGPYETDFPGHPAFSFWTIGGDERQIRESGERALAVTIDDVQPATRLLELFELGQRWGEPGVDPAQVIPLVAGRFRGNPAWTLKVALLEADGGRLDEAKALLRESVEHSPGHWETRFRLGWFLLDTGAYAEAFGVLRALPAFANADTHAVTIANAAYQAGSLFYWRGHFDEARWFYDIAAELETGSDSSLSAAARVALLGGDFRTAVMMQLKRVQRYGTIYGYRDYLSQLHLFGYSQQAWAAFDVAAARQTSDPIWGSAMVGHRIAGTSDADLVAWAQREVIAQAGDRHHRFAPRYLAGAAIQDRVPSDELIEAIAQMDTSTHKASPPGSMVARLRDDGRAAIPVGPSAPYEAIVPTGSRFRSGWQRVESDLSYFVRAYKALLDGDHDAALAIFEQQTALYDVFHNRLTYALPYYAYAAVRVGRTAAVEKGLANVRPARRRFDWHLARAMLAAGKAELDAALADVRAAWNHQEVADDRPNLPSYQYMELCEWLWEWTGDARFRDEAVLRARAKITAWPWFPFGYAFLAAHSQDEAERREALAKLLFLDPRSHRLGRLAPDEVQAARDALAGGNPFVKMLDAGSGTSL